MSEAVKLPPRWSVGSHGCYDRDDGVFVMPCFNEWIVIDHDGGIPPGPEGKSLVTPELAIWFADQASGPAAQVEAGSEAKT